MFGFLKKKNVLEIKSPIIGKTIEIGSVPDEVFSSGMIGDGVAFEPSQGVLYAPVDGEIIQMFPTKHAIGIRTNEGIEILLHIGIDTVNMKGEGFESFVKVGDKVKSGGKIVSFDINLINEKAKSIITPMIITNMDMVEKIEKNIGTCGLSTTVVKITLK